MNEKLHRSWQRFKESEPGRRFQDRYDHRQQSGSGRADAGKVLNVSLGIILILAGLFMVAFPGPGWITVFLGLGFVAGEFSPVARYMDKLELWAREVAGKFLKFWSRSSTAAKVLILSLAALLATALAAGAFLLIF